MHTSKKGSEIMAHGAEIIGALDAAWADIRAVHPDVPGVVMITGTAKQGRREMLTLGSFGAGRWRTVDGRLPQLFLAGELLTEQDGVSGGRRALETLLHEAAHGVAHTRKIADCSRQNRYHNRRFVELAAELGLTAPEKPHASIGWSECTLGDETAALWAPTIARIDAAALPYLDGVQVAKEGTEEGGGKGKGGKRRSAVCKCDPPRRLSITPKQLDSGDILCGVCREKFEPADDEEEG
jgi:hypothetical protein